MKTSYKRKILFGCLWFFGGIIVSAVSFSAAESEGGSYFVAWGAVLYGLIQIVRGLIGLARGGHDDDQGSVHDVVGEGVSQALARVREEDRQRERAAKG